MNATNAFRDLALSVEMNPDTSSYRLVVNDAFGQPAADIRVRPEYALRECEDLDFVRVIEDDGTYRILHMTANECVLGEVRLSGSMIGMLSTVVREVVSGL